MKCPLFAQEELMALMRWIQISFFFKWASSKWIFIKNFPYSASNDGKQGVYSSFDFLVSTWSFQSIIWSGILKDTRSRHFKRNICKVCGHFKRKLFLNETLIWIWFPWLNTVYMCSIKKSQSTCVQWIVANNAGLIQPGKRLLKTFERTVGLCI